MRKIIKKYIYKYIFKKKMAGRREGGATGVVQGIHGYTAYTHLFFSHHCVYPLLNPPDAHHSVVSAF